MVLLEVISRKKAGENGFAHRPVTALFALGRLAARQAGRSSLARSLGPAHWHGCSRPLSGLAYDLVLDEEKTRSQLPEEAPASLINLAMQCLDFDPGNRPDAEAVLSWTQDLCSKTEDEGIPDPPLPSQPDFPEPEPVRSPRSPALESSAR